MAAYDFLKDNTPVIPYRADPAQEPMSQPVKEINGQIVPADSTSGLYAIYGRKNTAQRGADMLWNMAGKDSGGTLGGLPGATATILAAFAQKKANKQDDQKETDIKAFMARKEAYDQIKNDRQERDYNAGMVEKAISAGWDANAAALQNGKTFEEAGAIAKDTLNQFATDNKVLMPKADAIHFWKGGDVSALFDVSGKRYEIVKKGDVMGWNDKGTMKPVPDGLLSVKDRADMTRANRAPAGANPDGMVTYYKDGRFLVKTKDAKKAQSMGATDVMSGSHDELDARNNPIRVPDFTPVEWTPREGGALVNTNPKGETPPPAAVERVAGLYQKPGLGQAPAPAPAAPQTAPSALSKDAQDAQAWILSNPHAPASQVAAIKAQYKLQ